MVSRYVSEWVHAHPNSFPPIVINITDGLVTDSPYEGTDLEGWAARLGSINTHDGNALLFHAYISPDMAQVMFPTTAADLPQPAAQLFEASSRLPDVFVERIRAGGTPVKPDARGLVLTTDLGVLWRFLSVGTRLHDRDRDGS